jgi:hypothetical protein
MLMLALLLQPGLTPAQDQKWKPFSSKAGGFSVLVPGVPTEKDQAITTLAGVINCKMYEVTLAQGALVTAYNDLPQKVQPGGEKAVLDGARDGAVANVKGKLLSDKDIKLGTAPGREVEIDVQGKARIRTRIYLVNGSRMYQVMVVGANADFPASKDANRFLDSFKLIGK